MSEDIGSQVDRYFRFLSDEFGFVKSHERCDQNEYEARFCAHDLAIRLEKYRRELYAYLSKPSEPHEEVNLFVLVDYLNNDTKDAVDSNYFRDEERLDECYRLQIEWLADVIGRHLPEIREFFSDKLYRENCSALKDYVIERHPDFYAR